LKTKEGMRSLNEGIDNQFRTAMSTLTGAFEMKSELIQYKNEFFYKAVETAKNEKFKGYVLDFSKQSIKAQKMADYLSLHNIQVSQLKKSITVNNHKYAAKTSLFIPIEQKQYTLIKSLFSTETSFKDNTFYDVSSWNIAMAWGLSYAEVKTLPEIEEIKWKTIFNNYSQGAIAYAFNWDDGNAAAALNYLQQRGIKTQVTEKTFTINLNGKTVKFKAGAIIISVVNTDEAKVLSAIANLSEFFQISSYALTNGLNEIGVDLGSPAISTIKTPKPLLLIGEGVNSYQAGSIWYLFDTEVGLPLTKVTQTQLNKLLLHEYTHLILPSGDYKLLKEKTHEKISAWIKNGGHLISFQKSANWTEKNIQKIDKDKKGEKQKTARKYGDFDKDNAKNTIGGAIVSATADLTHPLAYGMHQQTQYALIKGNSRLKPSKNPYATPLKANKKSLAAGYISVGKQKLINNSSLIIAEKMGKGSVVKFAFNPSFRGFWLGTQKWLINAVYFSGLINKTEIKDD